MKNYIKIQALMMLCALLLTACEEVIDISLNTTDPKIIIQGTVTDQNEPFRVLINKSVDFDQQNQYPSVSGAVVTISDGLQTFNLNETAPGIYQTADAQKGQIGRTYQLRVEAEGGVFEASTQMPEWVNFDTLLQDKLNFGGSEQTTLVPRYRDPLGMGNHYRFIIWRNNKILPDINVRDDRNSDGLSVSQPIFSQNEDLEMGDSIRVEMQTVDRAVYKYFYALAASGSNGPNSSVPGNPESNLSGGALGYFSVYTKQSNTIIIR